jgi:hypothetical protein
MLRLSIAFLTGAAVGVAGLYYKGKIKFEKTEGGFRVYRTDLGEKNENN